MAGVAGDRRVAAEVFLVDRASHHDHSPRGGHRRLIIIFPGTRMAMSAADSHRSRHEKHDSIEFRRRQTGQHLNVLVDLLDGFFLLTDLRLSVAARREIHDEAKTNPSYGARRLVAAMNAAQ